MEETSDLTNPAKLWKQDVENVSENWFRVYDLNRDNVITWKEYHSINSYNKKPLKNEKESFSFFDRNLDWRLTPKEFSKAKIQKLRPKK